MAVSPTAPAALRDDLTARLFEDLYRELHRLAERQLRARGQGATLGVTTLLHEAYLDMASRRTEFPDRGRFMAYAARAMRGLILNYARDRRALKRGGAFLLTSLDTEAGRCGTRTAKPRAPGQRPARPGTHRSPARRAGRPEVLLRFLLRRDRRHAHRLRTHRAARLEQGAAATAPLRRRSLNRQMAGIDPSCCRVATPRAYRPDGPGRRDPRRRAARRLPAQHSAPPRHRGRLGAGGQPRLSRRPVWLTVRIG